MKFGYKRNDIIANLATIFLLLREPLTTHKLEINLGRAIRNDCKGQAMAVLDFIVDNECCF